MNEGIVTLQENLSEMAMYQRLCHTVMGHDKPVNDDTKRKTQTMNSPFGNKTDFDFKVTVVEETIPNHSNVWNHWTGNGNSGMDTVAQAIDIDKTQIEPVPGRLNNCLSRTCLSRTCLSRTCLSRTCYMKWLKELKGTKIDYETTQLV